MVFLCRGDIINGGRRRRWKLAGLLRCNCCCLPGGHDQVAGDDEVVVGGRLAAAGGGRELTVVASGFRER